MLGGHPVLVVETEFIIALDLGARLQEMGAGQIVLASDAASARDQHPAWSGAVLALVEAHEKRPDLLDLVRDIEAAGIPVILVTTDADLALTPGRRPVLVKPVAGEALDMAVAAALGGSPPGSMA